MKINAIITEHSSYLDKSIWGGFANYSNFLRKGFWVNLDESPIASLIVAGDKIRLHPQFQINKKSIRKISKLLDTDGYQEKLNQVLETYDARKPTVIYHHFNSFELPDPWVIELSKDFNIMMVTTIIDFQEQDYPEFLGTNVKNKRERNYRTTLNHAKAFVTASKFLVNDASNYFDIDSREISVAPLGSNHIPSREELRDYSIKYLTSTSRPYFVYPAKSWSHKGHREILKSYAEFKPEFRLIFVGSLTTIRKELEYFVESNSLHNDVEILDYLSDIELFKLLSMSSGLIFPSIYEGFGLPYIEAARLKIPIFAIENKSTKELFNNENGYFAPAKDFSKLIRLCNSSLQDDSKERKIENLYAKALNFTWEETARITMKVYENVIQS